MLRMICDHILMVVSQIPEKQLDSSLSDAPSYLEISTFIYGNAVP